MNLTIAIPTFNGAPRLAEVLSYLQAQQLPQDGAASSPRWEILIVDNNSNDNTAGVVTQLQQDWATGPWGDDVPLRYCFEPQAGLAYARQRAIAEAKGDWVGFIDDDNWTEPDWVASAMAFADANPELGAFGSRIKAVYEIEPPDNFQEIEAFLAIRDHGDNEHPFDPEQLQLPPGAGMVVHRQRWLDSVPAVMSVVGRTADVLISGSDSAVLMYLHRAGHGIAYNPRMVIHHAIPAARLNRAYLLPLAYGIGMAICQLRFINVEGGRRWEIGLRTFLGGLRRVFTRLWQHGPALRADLNLTFWMCFYLGGMLSPVLAVAPRVGTWLNFQRIRIVAQFLLLLWPLSPSSSRPTTPSTPSPLPLNPS